ncbi:Mg(2+) transport ATPase, P-type [Williamsoniiplasma somnilux]|uniref:Magnesium-transporting ATPase, P-type 1 n=1 Tax=Williamsoniiplasma somnilux TaxID=215578 RepID=A0A2K8P227_9MOLU|nr:magnesium-translocating P-type ATPase [Williamsoniiplasma somnilux]ATZ18953.1 Mg(2+) transport ATPase, P-type [Williamsoniiplasma somnilux]
MIKIKSKLISKDKQKNKRKNGFSNEGLIKKVSKFNQDELKHEFNLTHFGLTHDEYTEREEKYGRNELKKSRFNWGLEFFRAFLGPFNLILIAITIYYFTSYATYSFGTEETRTSFDIVGAIIITIMVILSGTISFVQSARSYFITKKISTIVQSTTNVIRHKSNEDLLNFLNVDQNNQVELVRLGEEIDIKTIVPGDLIYLSSGDMIPADVRIIQSTDLFINQSSLTGESLPVEKHANNLVETTNILDLQNICYIGTSVVSGSAIAFVIATGSNTYFSTIAKTIMEKRPEGSFTKGVKNVTHVLLGFMLVMVPIVYLINAGVHWAGLSSTADLTLKDNPWFNAIFFAVAVAVGLTPEMLPMIVTTNLANGAGRMAKQKVVVKKLDAIQSLGAIDVLCTDKTGTLTNDKIELIDFLTTDKVVDPRLLEYLYMNAYFQTGLKNPMDKAIIDYASKNNINFNTHKEFKKVDEIPFDFNRRKLTIVFDSQDDGRVMVTKGSTEEILSSCDKIYYQGKIQPINEQFKRQAIAYYEKINSQGKRVLGIAYKEIANEQKRFAVSDETEMIFFGFASFLDTPKPSTTKMIKLLKKYGVDLKIITGDNESVTRAVCNMINLEIRGILTGVDVDKMSDEELKKAVEKCNIFVKLNPLQKVKIVKTLKENNHIIGYMGDGINDAPVLRQSDVGISVNNATDIAKDASDIILLEKSLLVLEKGIIQGRTIFGNILKYIKLTTSSNFGNTLSLIVASAWLPFLPMLPVQILFQNLFYDLSQFAMAVDRVDESFVHKPQRWKANDIIPFVLFFGPISSMFDVITFAIVGYGLNVIPEYNSAMNNGFVDQANQLAAKFQGSWFLIGLITQAMVVQILRTEKVPLIQSRSPWPVNVTMVGMIVLAYAIPYSPIGGLLSMNSPSLWFILISFGIISGYCMTAQFGKVGYKKIFKHWL